VTTHTRMCPALATVVIAAMLGALTGCNAPRPDPLPTSTPPSPTSRLCTGSVGEDALRGFFRDLSNQRPVAEVLATYVVPAQDFVRWWDGTLKPGETRTFYNGLEEHLQKLQQGGLDLTVGRFNDVGFQGRGTRDAGGWFTFSLQGRMNRSERASAGRTLGNKGAADCATGKLKAIVI
jgi:hypothetical protein